MPDTQDIPGLEYTNYLTASRTPPAITPAASPIAASAPSAMPNPTSFVDKTVSFADRMARNQLPVASPSPSPLEQVISVLHPPTPALPKASTAASNLIDRYGG